MRGFSRAFFVPAAHERFCETAEAQGRRGKIVFSISYKPRREIHFGENGCADRADIRFFRAGINFFCLFLLYFYAFFLPFLRFFA
jgi:hypothetical protein